MAAEVEKRESTREEYSCCTCWRTSFSCGRKEGGRGEGGGRKGGREGGGKEEGRWKEEEGGEEGGEEERWAEKGEEGGGGMEREIDASECGFHLMQSNNEMEENHSILVK